MERSVVGSDRPVPTWSGRPFVASGRTASEDAERSLPVALLLILAGEVAAAAALAASGNMPGIVSVLYRALLTL